MSQCDHLLCSPTASEDHYSDDGHLVTSLACKVWVYVCIIPGKSK